MADTINIVFLGDEAVGKHELIHAIINGELASLVTDYNENELEVELNGAKRKVALCCSEPDNDKDNLMMLLRAHVVVLTYGLDSFNSLESLATLWAPKVHEYCPDTPMYLLGCKSDLVQDEPDEVAVGDKQVAEVCRMVGAVGHGQCSSQQKVNLLESLVTAQRIAMQHGKSGTQHKKKCVVM